MSSSAIHKTFRAFTLLELLVGMILSGIVLTATFSAYRIITRQYTDYCEKAAATGELSFFLSTFRSDFSAAKNVFLVSENKVQLVSGEKKLEYTFSGKMILRNDAVRVDTFKVETTETTAYYQSASVSEENAAIDELHVTLSIDEKKEEKIYTVPAEVKPGIDKIEQEDNEHGH